MYINNLWHQYLKKNMVVTVALMSEMSTVGEKTSAALSDRPAYEIFDTHCIYIYIYMQYSIFGY